MRIEIMMITIVTTKYVVYDHDDYDYGDYCGDYNYDYDDNNYDDDEYYGDYDDYNHDYDDYSGDGLKFNRQVTIMAQEHPWRQCSC